MKLKTRLAIAFVTFSVLPILFVGLYPFFWNMFVANHSQIHFWFTFRSQSILIFALLTSGCVLIQKRKKDRQ